MSTQRPSKIFLISLIAGFMACGAASAAGAATGKSAKSLKVGETFKDCDLCPEMVVIPGGKFKMGSNWKKAKKNQKPVHAVTIKGPLAVSKFEITFDEWEACLADGVCKRDPDDHKWGRGRRPIVNISWSDTQEYTAWLSKKTGRKYRLLSEAEWEYAARAGTTTGYWWGNKLKKKYANCRKCGTPWSGKKSAPVGSFKPNPWGIYDMHANIWEWVQDCWTNDHKGAPSDGSARTDGNCERKSVRGGSWYYYSQVAKSPSRDSHPIHLWSYNIGIRLAVSLY